MHYSLSVGPNESHPRAVMDEPFPPSIQLAGWTTDLMDDRMYGWLVLNDGWLIWWMAGCMDDDIWLAGCERWMTYLIDDWIAGCMYDWMYGWLAEWTTWCMYDWIYDWLDVWMTGCIDDWIYGFDIWMTWCMDNSVWMTGCIDDLICGWLDVWMTGCINDRMYGQLDVWMTGNGWQLSLRQVT